jgi:putative oxidoreductase
MLKKRTLIIEIVSGLLILLFLYTGLSKLFEHDLFLYNLNKSPLLSPVSKFTSIALPIGEIILAVLLFFKRTQLKGLWLSLGLMSVFTIYLTYMVTFYDKLPCSCGGVISKMSWTQHIFFNALFVVLSWIAIRLSNWNTNRLEEGSQPKVIFT